MNYFEVFELPRRLAIDAGDLQRRFYELSRQHHPDFHQAATPADQAAALERSALVNVAYRHLRDPIARAEYLVQLEEGRPWREGGRERPKAPPELLAEDAIKAALADYRERWHTADAGASEKGASSS